MGTTQQTTDWLPEDLHDEGPDNEFTVPERELNQTVGDDQIQCLDCWEVFPLDSMHLVFSDLNCDRYLACPACAGEV